MVIQPREESNSMHSESRMYIYATEMVSSYYSLLNLKDKSVLTIIGSGDQILNAYFFGASEVTGFDINRRSAFFLDLKIQALLNLTLGEFVTFFGDKFGAGDLKKETYLRLREGLKEDTQEFFDHMYEEVAGSDIYESEYFRKRSYLEVKAADLNAYLEDDESYMKMRSIIQNARPKLVVGNIQEIAPELPKSHFDIINMSNVLNYFVGKKEDRIEIMLELLKVLATTLRKDGLLFFYSYSPEIYEGGTTPPASRLDTRERINNLGIFDIDEKSFTGTNLSSPDRITILKLRNLPEV